MTCCLFVEERAAGGIKAVGVDRNLQRYELAPRIHAFARLRTLERRSRHGAADLFRSLASSLRGFLLVKEVEFRFAARLELRSTLFGLESSESGLNVRIRGRPGDSRRPGGKAASPRNRLQPQYLLAPLQ